MSLILSGTDGLSDVDGTAATPAIRGTDANTGIFFPAADTIAFAEGGVESMRIDSSGRVGIGTSSPSFPLDIASADANIRVAPSITTNNALTRYINTGGTGFVGLDNSVAGLTSAYALNIYHSGAYPINFSTNGVERARIDSSGNLGLGVSPSAWFSDYRVLQIGLAGSAFNDNYNEDFNIGSNTFADTRGGYKFIRTGYAQRYVQTNSGQHRWLTSNISGTAGNAITFTQAMTLDASGNLLLGQSSGSGYRLNVKAAFTSGLAGAYIEAGEFNQSLMVLNHTNAAVTSNLFQVQKSGTGVLTLDSSGNLLVASTNSSTSSGSGIKFNADGKIGVVATSAALGDTYNYYNSTAGAYRFYVNNAGTIFATSTTISAISDQRLKENVRDLEFGLSEVMALKPRRFDWKEGKGQDKKNAAGFIAQEFETVFPDSVGTSKAGEDGVEYKNINHEELIPTLVKAIQEQSALITQLTARITALEGA